MWGRSLEWAGGSTAALKPGWTAADVSPRALLPCPDKAKHHPQQTKSVASTQLMGWQHRAANRDSLQVWGCESGRNLLPAGGSWGATGVYMKLKHPHLPGCAHTGVHRSMVRKEGRKFCGRIMEGYSLVFCVYNSDLSAMLLIESLKVQFSDCQLITWCK